MVGGKNLKERHQNASLIFYRFPRYCILIPKIKITIDDYCYDTNKDAEVIKTINDNLFLNFNQAQEEQSRLRKKIIESRFEDMSKAITNYNAAVLKYFNKPLSTLKESCTD